MYDTDSVERLSVESVVKRGNVYGTHLLYCTVGDEESPMCDDQSEEVLRYDV
jgi:hypothetical protein